MRSIFLALTVTTAYAHLRGWPEELHPVLRSCFAVLVLVLGFGLWRKRVRPSCSQARAVRAPRWPDYLAVGLSILAVECLFLFFLSAIPPRAEQLALTVEEVLLPERSARRSGAPPNGAGDGSGQVVSGNWLWDEQGMRRLPLRTNARPSNRPEVFFRPADRDVTGHLLRTRPYIRAFALERYRGAAWLPADQEAVFFTADSEGWIDLPQPAGRPGPLLRGRIYHAAHPGGQDVLTALQGAVRVQIPSLRQVDPGIFRLDPLRNPDPGYDYEVVSRTATLDSLLEGGEVEAFLLPPEIPSHLLETPEDDTLRQALIDIAVKTQGPTEARLLALRKILQREYEYSLEVENPDGRDPVLNFLQHERRGHCEFFATAGALLCRTLGIPARVAYGWTGGRYYQAQNLFMFRAREAHAWTEVYLQDIGWVVFDPTPPGALEAGFSIAPPDEQPPLDADSPLEAEGGSGDPERERGWAFVALGVGIGLLPFAAFILRFRRRPAVLAGGSPSALLPDSPGYLQRFRQACHRRGVPMPAGRTLRQQLAALAREDDAPPFAGELLDYHYAVTYGSGRPDRSRESALLKAIRRWV